MHTYNLVQEIFFPVQYSFKLHNNCMVGHLDSDGR